MFIGVLCSHFCKTDRCLFLVVIRIFMKLRTASKRIGFLGVLARAHGLHTTWWCNQKARLNCTLRNPTLIFCTKRNLTCTWPDRCFITFSALLLFKVVCTLHGLCLVCILIAMTVDPAEGVLRSRNSIRCQLSFDSTKHQHVIENFYCNICDIQVWVWVFTLTLEHDTVAFRKPVTVFRSI